MNERQTNREAQQAEINQRLVGFLAEKMNLDAYIFLGNDKGGGTAIHLHASKAEVARLIMNWLRDEPKFISAVLAALNVLGNANCDECDSKDTCPTGRMKDEPNRD